MPLDEAVIDYQPIGATQGTDGAVRQRILLVAARESMVSRIVDAVKAAGLKPESVDLDAFALVRTLAEPESENGDELRPARVLCHLGGTTNLAIAAGSDLLLHPRPLHGVGGRAADASASALAEEIRLCIDYHLAQPDARPVGEIVLSGPGALRRDPCRRAGQPRRPAGVGGRAARRAGHPRGARR